MFKGCHFDRSVILLCVRWRDLEEMMAERGISVDHSSVHRRVVRFSPLLAEAVQSAQARRDPQMAHGRNLH